MKKIILTLAAIFAISFANAQEGKFKAGVILGLPMGDVKDLYSFTVGLDVAYMWSISDEFKAGVTTGYATYLGKTVDYFDFDTFETYSAKAESAGFIPVAATAQYSLSESFFVGADLGYAIAIAPSGADSGLLYQPKVGYQAEKFEVYAGYKGIAVTGGTFTSVNLGFNYKF